MQFLTGTWEELSLRVPTKSKKQLTLVIPEDTETIEARNVMEPEVIKSLEQLEELLIEATQSGPPIKITPVYWVNKRNELLAEHANRSS